MICKTFEFRDKMTFIPVLAPLHRLITFCLCGPGTVSIKKNNAVT
jgi:hypothetical protein